MAQLLDTKVDGKLTVTGILEVLNSNTNLYTLNLIHKYNNTNYKYFAAMSNRCRYGTN